MPINTITGNGMLGVERGNQKVQSAANNIARLNTAPDQAQSLTRSAVDLIQGKNQVQASAKVIETENRTLGSLLNIKV